MIRLIPAMINKAVNDITLTPTFADRVYALWNPNDPTILTTMNKFPFIGITAGIIERVHEGSQLLYEALRPKIWIYDERYEKETGLFTRLIGLQMMVMEAFQYKIDLVGYTGAPLIDCWCIQLGEPEPFNTPDHPMAARISLTMEYQRVTEEVLT